MTSRRAALLLLVLSLAVAAGCARPDMSAAPPPAPPPKKAEEPPPKPEPKPALPKANEPVKLTLPEKPPAPEKKEPEPWVVGRAPDPADHAPLVFPGVAPFAATGVAVRPEANRAVVTFKVEKKGQPTGTRICLCDTAAGKTLHEWVVPGELGALDLSPDGRSILATAPNPGRGRDTLRLWLAAADGQLKRWAWAPHDEPFTGPPVTPSGRQMTASEAVEVRWAAFVGNDRVVTISKGGQIRVYDTDGPKAIATLDATPCRPAVTPDGSRVAFLAGEEVALLDPTAGRIVATRPLGPPPPYPVLAFSPCGTRLAVGGNGKVLLMDMATAAVKPVALPKLRVTDNGTYDKSFGWAGERYLYADQQLHDPNFPLPLWDYRGAETGQFRGWQLWLAVRTQGSGALTVRPFTLPHIDAQYHVTAAKTRPGMFALRPGNGVRIDVNGVPGDRRDEVKAALEARLKDIGYVADASAPAVLFASVEPVGVQTSAAYTFGSFNYTRRPARLRLVLNGKDLWAESWATAAPFSFSVRAGDSAADVFASFRVGEPNYDLFTQAPIPPYFPGPNAPKGAFGLSEFTPAGLKEWARQ